MKFILYLLLSIPLIPKAQDSLLYAVFPMREGKISYEKVIELESASKADLYNRAKEWALTYYTSQKDALQTDDKESGIVAYKGYFSLPYTVTEFGQSSTFTWNYWETVKILLKDGRAKIIVTDLYIKQYGAGEFTIEGFESYLNKQYGNKSFQKFKAKARQNSLENFALAHNRIESLIGSIADHLSGKKKSDFDF